MVEIYENVIPIVGQRHARKATVERLKGVCNEVLVNSEKNGARRGIWSKH